MPSSRMATGEQKRLTHTYLCDLRTRLVPTPCLSTPVTTSEWTLVWWRLLRQHPGSRSLLGLEGWGRKPPGAINATAAITGPFLLHVFLAIFIFPWWSMLEAVQFRTPNDAPGTHGISILTIQGWSTLNHHTFMIKHLKKPPQTIWSSRALEMCSPSCPCSGILLRKKEEWAVKKCNNVNESQNKYAN